MKNCLVILALLTLLSAPARAQLYAPIDTAAVVVCEANGQTEIPADFTGPGCESVGGHYVNPHKRLIWVKGYVEVPETLAATNIPLGFFISAKASSTIWLNGKKLGSNGIPASTEKAETPGKMDAVLPLRPGLLKAGDNEVIILMSGYHGFFRLMAPLHFIAVAPYMAPTDDILRGYLPAFLPLGVLLIGAFYFGVLALRRRHRRELLLVPLAALFAAGQLLAEVARGLWAYDYPFHDIRLALIFLCACASGASLFLHVLLRFAPKRRLGIAVVAVAIFMAVVLPAGGFDVKSTLALLVPSLLAALIAGYAAIHRRAPHALAYALALFLFAGIILLAPTRFLDIYFYYCVAALLLFLFVQQIRQQVADSHLRAQEKARADRLQLILDESREQTNPSNVTVSSAGKVDVISSSDIVFCKGAGDYVELTTTNRGAVLHNARLSDLEAELPGTFLRVHRSYLVNTAFVAALERDPSGAGRLELTSGGQIPVSRRIMPQVRKALR
ncbi:LytTR family DNA-binding domain-containing protein [Kordiimonas sp.]|uniref:LytTR family DNA-binding domain-containing protein n=1 Tax=Kordiimonas sp. TaxID=1970157 RepID=UPI003A957541